MAACLVFTMANAMDAQVVQKSPGSATRNSGKLDNSVIRLNSVSDNQARAGELRISDPFILTLNERAKGYDAGIKDVEILGLSKGAYGYSHGRLKVFPSGTTSSGTITGMGAVATGSSPGSMGSIGLGMGANGKSPFAGTGMWGNSRGLNISRTDTISRSWQ